jgi:hypothetical protein
MLRVRRRHLEALFQLNVYNLSKVCHILLETVSLHVPNRNIGDFTLFHVDYKHRNCTSTRYPSAANTISRDIGIFNGRSVLINSVLDVGIFTKYVRTLKQILHCSSVTNISCELWF